MDQIEAWALVEFFPCPQPMTFQPKHQRMYNRLTLGHEFPSPPNSRPPLSLKWQHRPPVVATGLGVQEDHHSLHSIPPAHLPQVQVTVAKATMAC